ncbi:MAG: polyphosphate polymerase domain-containing protein [bacterium]
MFWESKQGQRDLVTRHEAKYIIPRSLIPQLRDFIQPFCAPDYHAHGTPPEYTITTLQLDTADHALHYAKARDAVRRFKLRVRTYGELGSAPLFAEVKAKLEDTIRKTRVEIPFQAWNKSLVLGVQLPDFFKNKRQEIDFLQFKRLVWELGARPVLLVRYVRESYVGTVDRYARVTFDTKLHYQMTDSWTDFGRSGVWRGMDSTEAQGFGLPYSGVVMELKTPSYTPLWAMDLVERFQLRKSGNCKYSTALWREGFFRGHPETNDAAAEALTLV